jgi:type II secretory pathway component PulF
MFMKIPLEQLSVLCQNVATCLSAGLRVPASLRASVRSSGRGALKGIVETAAERTASGGELSEALEPSKDRLPPFFLPVVRCGEQSGRLDEAFHYLARHCRLMVRPSRMARNAWLFPLVIVLTGSVIKVALVAAFAPIAVTVAYVGSTLLSYAMAAALVGVVLFVPWIRAILDRVKLAVPVLGPTERDLAVNRFFQALNLVYSTGGVRVEAMIRLAAQSVDNRAIRSDLVRAAEVIEAGGTISDTFRASQFISWEYKETICVGEEAGKLDRAFDIVARLTEEALEHRLNMFNKVFQRIVSSAVSLSIVATVFWLITTFQPGM